VQAAVIDSNKVFLPYRVRNPDEAIENSKLQPNTIAVAWLGERLPSLKMVDEKKTIMLIPDNCWKADKEQPTQAASRITGSQKVCLKLTCPYS